MNNFLVYSVLVVFCGFLAIFRKYEPVVPEPVVPEPVVPEPVVPYGRDNVRDYSHTFGTFENNRDVFGNPINQVAVDTFRESVDTPFGSDGSFSYWSLR